MKVKKVWDTRGTISWIIYYDDDPTMPVAELTNDEMIEFADQIESQRSDVRSGRYMAGEWVEDSDTARRRRPTPAPQIPRKDRCSACKGVGTVHTTMGGIVTCSDCQGTGGRRVIPKATSDHVIPPPKMRKR
jgi:hypothetical protein